MKRPVSVTVAALVAAGVAGSAHGTAVNCAPVRATLVADRAYATAEACSGDVTPWAYVDGHQLRFAELSHHATTATFYGHATVVRIVQTSGRVMLTALALDLARLRVRFQLAASTT